MGGTVMEIKLDQDQIICYQRYCYRSLVGLLADLKFVLIKRIILFYIYHVKFDLKEKIIYQFLFFI